VGIIARRLGFKIYSRVYAAPSFLKTESVASDGSWGRPSERPTVGDLDWSRRCHIGWRRRAAAVEDPCGRAGGGVGSAIQQRRR
jgi:hypothetical protein